MHVRMYNVQHIYIYICASWWRQQLGKYIVVDHSNCRCWWCTWLTLSLLSSAKSCFQYQKRNDWFYELVLIACVGRLILQHHAQSDWHQYPCAKSIGACNIDEAGIMFSLYLKFLFGSWGWNKKANTINLFRNQHLNVKMESMGKALHWIHILRCEMLWKCCAMLFSGRCGSRKLFVAYTTFMAFTFWMSWIFNAFPALWNKIAQTCTTSFVEMGWSPRGSARGEMAKWRWQELQRSIQIALSEATCLIGTQSKARSNVWMPGWWSTHGKSYKDRFEGRWQKQLVHYGPKQSRGGGVLVCRHHMAEHEAKGRGRLKGRF